MRRASWLSKGETNIRGPLVHDVCARFSRRGCSYANRAKNIKNKPTINEDPKDAMLRSFQEQLEKLKSKLSGKRGGKKKRRRKPKFRIDAEGNEVPCSSDDDDGEDDDGDNGVTEEALEKAEYEKQQVFTTLLTVANGLSANLNHRAHSSRVPRSSCKLTLLLLLFFA